MVQGQETINGTSPSAISTEMKMRMFLWTLTLSLACTCAPAQVFLTKDQALRQYFREGAAIERKVAYLTEDQCREIRKRGKAPFDSKMVTYYAGRIDSAIEGYAFLETQTIRTMPAVIMTVLRADGTIRGVELLAFYEPEDYLPSRRWLQQFTGKSEYDDLLLKRGIAAIAGATLSAQVIAQSVRRTLAFYYTILDRNRTR